MRDDRGMRDTHTKEGALFTRRSHSQADSLLSGTDLVAFVCRLDGVSCVLSAGLPEGDVRKECRASVQRISPGRPGYNRRDLRMSQADSTRFLLQIALLLAVGLSFGHLARLMRLPAVVGELFGGILLGPTLLGRIAPSLLAWLFPTFGPVATAREGVLKLALLSFLFAAGLEVNLAHVRRNKAAV